MLKGILAITGQPGLFKLVAEAKNRIIVESLLTGKRMPANPSAKISALEDIAVYTQTSDIPLKEVLKKINDHESGGTSLSAKSTDTDIRKYFETIVPEYDKDRVYVSDMKKIILWYNILHDKHLLDFTVEEIQDESDTVADSETSE